MTINTQDYFKNVYKAFEWSSPLLDKVADAIWKQDQSSNVELQQPYDDSK